MAEWQPLTSKTLTEQVYCVLRERIVAGNMEVGQFIREQEVSRGLGVSRTPVREALGRLASEGFLEHLPHRGFRLPQQSIAELVELYPIIDALEVLAGRFAFPHLDSKDISRLRNVNREYEKAMLRRDIRAGIELNDQFHHLLSEKSRNRHLCELLDGLRSQVTRLEIWSFSRIDEWRDSLDEHEEILRAIEKRDYEQALAVLENNRLTTYTDFVERIARGQEDTSDEKVG